MPWNKARFVGLPFVRSDGGRVSDALAVTVRPDNSGDITIMARSYEDHDGQIVEEVCIQPIDVATLRTLVVLTPAGNLIRLADVYDREAL